MKKFVIVGLGLIGGSMAMALKGFQDFEIIGVARRQATVDYANSHGVGDKATLDLASVLPQGVDFIGCHPMAGTEFSGVEHAFPEMFQGSHLILTPRKDSAREHVALMESLAEYIGCRDMVKTTPERHDQILAYTSQMMHVIAVSVCDDPELFACKGYEGSSFRGCTRVAALDAKLWTQLFSLNSPALVDCLDELIGHLQSYRETIAAGDREALLGKLTVSSDRKRQVDLPGPDLLN